MAWSTIKGMNFRTSAVWGTDPTNTTGVYDDMAYPTTLTIGGESVVCGWTSVTDLDSRDRNVASDNRLRGMHFITASRALEFRVDVPSAGTYKVRVALGDEAGSSGKLEILDGLAGTVRLTVADSSIAAQAWVDAAGTERNESTWVSSNAQSAELTISGTVLSMRLTCDGTYTSPRIAYLEIEQISSGGGGSTFVPQVIMVL